MSFSHYNGESTVLTLQANILSFFFLYPFNFLIIMESKWLKQNKMGQWWEVNLEGQAEAKPQKEHML